MASVPIVMGMHYDVYSLGWVAITVSVNGALIISLIVKRRYKTDEPQKCLRNTHLTAALYLQEMLQISAP